MAFRVVVVDDDPDVRRVVAIELERAGFSVVTTPDAASGLAAVLREAPDVAVVDRMLPDGDGLDLVGTLRATLAGACPVIVVLSARTELAEVAEGIAAGADDYVTKPFSPRDLVERIQVALDPPRPDPGARRPRPGGGGVARRDRRKPRDRERGLRRRRRGPLPGPTGPGPAP